MAFTMKDGVIVALAAVSIYLLIDKFTGQPINDNACACDNKKRGGVERDGGGRAVTPDEAREMVGAFGEKYFREEPEAARGGFISKNALDQIFCNADTANGIYFYFAREGDHNCLFVEPGKTEYVKTACRENDVMFVSMTRCPNICGSF